MNIQERQVFEFGPFRLDPREHQLFSDGKPVPLTPKSFDVLRVLIENAGHLVEKGELMNQVWPDSFVEEANLSVKMTEVRRALGEAPGEQRYIETVPRRGYRFVGEVRKSQENGDEVPAKSADADHSDHFDPAEALAATPAETSQPSSESGSPVKMLLFGLGALLALVAIAAVFDVGGVRSRFSAPGSQRPIRSIAVLPLENFSGDPSQDYFAQGMTDAVITELAKIGSLRIISMMQYKDPSRPLSDIARELNVDAFLTGSVVRSADRVRISARLVSTATDENLWSESYERDLRDILSLQKEVTRHIAGEIRIKLTPQEQLQFGNAPPVNPDAYDKYLQGRYHLNNQEEASNQKAIDSLEAAVTADPSFTAAYAELAQAYVWKFFLFRPEDQELKEKAYVTSQKALSMDPNLASAHLAFGRLLWTPPYQFQHEKAIREYRRALELNPNLDEARNQLALVLNHIGAEDEALAELRRALEINPGNNVAAFRIGETLLFAGRYEEAITALRAVPTGTNPALIGHQLVWALWNLGRKDEAMATMNEFLSKYPDDDRGLMTSMQAVMAAVAGRNEEAESKIRQAIEKGKGFGHFHHTQYHIACAYARMDQPGSAIDYLEDAANKGFPNFTLFATDPNLDGLRQHPRFIAMLERLRKQRDQFTSAQ